MKRQPPRWIIHPLDRERQVELSRSLAISPITASVLLARGIDTPEQARDWLTQQEMPRHDPFLLPDMEETVDRVHQAVRQRESICCYGDYDVDGISATSIFKTFFRSLGAEVSVYIPHRVNEGYGLSIPALHAIRAQGVTLVMTSDCGTTAHREIEAANDLGLEVIVTDHHQPGTHLPPARAVVNPHRPEAAYPFRSLCSAGLAYKVAQAYEVKYGVGELQLEQMCDLVALATVADVMPLWDENRFFVRQGLAQITKGSRCGVRALKKSAGVERACTAGTIGFKLAPRLNAAGRLAHAAPAVRLLTTDSELEAATIAQDLERLNLQRQELEESIKVEAIDMVEGGPLDGAIVVASRNWHLGVVGVVAARLVERFERPAVVLAINQEGIAKGSARSLPGFDVHAALAACQDVLIGFGGHPAAAGMTVRESDIPGLRDRLAGLASRWIAAQPSARELKVDAEVSLSEVNYRLVNELSLLQPHGIGNPEPTLAVRNLRILDSRVVGARHLKLTVRHGNSVPFDTIGFRMGSLADLGLSRDVPVDLAFVPALERWNGLDRVQLRIRDLRASQGL